MNQQIYGLRRFLLEIISLVSCGEKESVSIIEEHIQKGDIVRYLDNKYRCNLNTDTWEPIEKHFAQWAGCTEGVEDRRYGVRGEENGLLLVLALALNNVF